ncbi:MAG: tRNA-dihydrouridine synthase family protein [Planctomycetota bacterium]
MGCTGNNATPPSPAIAPGSEQIDPRRVAEDLAARHGPGGATSRLAELIPGFDAPFFQAGLAGYSDPAMRLIARDHGCPLCVTEALLDRTLLAGGRGFAKADLGDIADNIPGGERDRPLVGQIMGSEPSEMAVAAIKMVEQGERAAREYRAMVGAEPSDSADPGEEAPSDRAGFASIDVNLACPVKKISRKARGGHWLAQPEGAIRILEAVREALPSSVNTSLKIRRSFDDGPEFAEAFDRILDAAIEMGYAFATIHGRTVQQKYIGPSRWDLLRELVDRHRAAADRHGAALFGSGDVWTAGDVFRMIEYTGVDAVSVARGCIGNPWVFRQCRDLLAGLELSTPSVAEQRDVLERHFELALSCNGWMRNPEKMTGKTMRKFGIRFAQHHPEGEQVRQRMIKVSSPEDWRAVLDDFYGDEHAELGSTIH